jgi:hypothetical protein
LVKYLMACIMSGIHRKYLYRRLEISDRHAFLLGQLYMLPDGTLREAFEEEMMTLEDVKDLVTSKLKAEPAAHYIMRNYGSESGDGQGWLREMSLKGMLQEDARETFQMLREMSVPEGGHDVAAGLNGEELQRAVESIQEEVLTLRDIIEANRHLAAGLETAFLLFAGLIITLLSLMLLHADGYLFALQIIAMITGFGYLTEDMFRRMFSCFMFAFVQHPVDIGDVVSMDGKRFRILRVHLLSVEAVELVTGTLHDMAVSSVAVKNIYNLTRSKLLPSDKDLADDSFG